MQFNHFKSAIMLGLRIVSNISLAPAAVKCEAFALSLASASGQATSTNLRHGVWHPGFFCGPSTNSFSTASVRCCLSAPAARGSQGGTNGRLMQITQSLSSSAPSKDEFFSRTARATLSRSESRTRAATAALQIKIQTQIQTQTQTQTHGWCGNQVENARNGPSPCGSVPQGPPGLYLQASRCSFQWARLREFVWVWCQCVALSES